MEAEKAEILIWHHLFRRCSHVPNVKIVHDRRGIGMLVRKIDWVEPLDQD